MIAVRAPQTITDALEPELEFRGRERRFPYRRWEAAMDHNVRPTRFRW